jgi:hypothetical protein
MAAGTALDHECSEPVYVARVEGVGEVARGEEAGVSRKGGGDGAELKMFIFYSLASAASDASKLKLNLFHGFQIHLLGNQVIKIAIKIAFSYFSCREALELLWSLKKYTRYT